MNKYFKTFFLFSRESFFKTIQAKYLYDAAILFTACSLALVIAIYIHLYYKKRRYFSNESINGILNESITNSLISENDISISEFDNKQLKHFLVDETNRQYVIDRLINIQKNISGQASYKIPEIYLLLDLKKHSLKKLRQKGWHHKARGIFELYMMNQNDMQEEIQAFTNHPNEFLRMEAQTATISFGGFEGLSFLNDLTRPLHQWQQLKIIEQLHPLDPINFPDLSAWLNSSNDYVVLFALKLADIYQVMETMDIVAGCLNSPNEKIRRQAIQTICRLDTGTGSEKLIEHYPLETQRNKILILKQLADIGNEIDSSFLIQTLYEEQDDLKLGAVRAIVNTNPNGWHLMKLLSENDPVLLSIMKQVKYETTK